MAIPVWLTAQNITTVTVQALVANTAGVLSTTGDGVETLYGAVREVLYNGVLRSESVTALTSVRENEVPIERDDSFTLVEMLKSDDANAYHASAPQYNILAKLWAMHMAATPVHYVRVTFSRGKTGVGGGPGGLSWSFDGLIQSYDEEWNKGVSTGRMTIQMIDLGDGVTNPTVTAVTDP